LDEFGLQELYSMLALRQEILVVEQQSALLGLGFCRPDGVALLAKKGADFVAYARCNPAF
jgi:predicted GNAT family N-acyltransferase